MAVEIDQRRLVRVVVLALEFLGAEDEGLLLFVLVGVVCCCVSCGLFDVRHCWLAREGVRAQGEGLVLHAERLEGDLGAELGVGWMKWDEGKVTYECTDGLLVVAPYDLVVG